MKFSFVAVKIKIPVMQLELLHYNLVSYLVPFIVSYYLNLVKTSGAYSNSYILFDSLFLMHLPEHKQ